MKWFRQYILILAVLALALVLRLPMLNGSFWLDEAAQALESARPLSQQLNIALDFQPPLIHLMVHFALLVSKSEWWLRAVAALVPSLITIAVTFQIGRRLGSDKVGLAAALLLATSSFHIFYSQELRPYALPALWATVSWWLLLEATTLGASPTGKKSGAKAARPWWLGFSAATALGLYSSYLYPFLILGQLSYITWQRRTQIYWMILSLSIAAVSFLPWVPMFLQQLRVGGRLREMLPGWAEVVSTPQLKALPLLAVKVLFGVLDVEPTMGYLLTVIVILVAGFLTVWNLFLLWSAQPLAVRQKQWHVLAFLSCWLFVPVLAAWVVSFWIPVLQPKRVLYIFPAVYLMVSYLASLVSVKSGRLVTWSLPLVLLSINIFSTWSYYTQPKLQREDWRSLHARITARYPAGKSLAVFAFDAPFAPWQWYDDGSYSTLSLEPLRIEGDSALAENMKHLTEYEYIVLFDYLRDLSDPSHRLEAQVQAFGYQPVEVLDQPNVGFVRIYSQPQARLSDNQVE